MRRSTPCSRIRSSLAVTSPSPPSPFSLLLSLLLLLCAHAGRINAEASPAPATRPSAVRRSCSTMIGLALRFPGRLVFPFIVGKRLGESAQHLGRGFEHAEKLRFIAAFDIVAPMILQPLSLSSHFRAVQPASTSA